MKTFKTKEEAQAAFVRSLISVGVEPVMLAYAAMDVVDGHRVQVDCTPVGGLMSSGLSPGVSAAAQSSHLQSIRTVCTTPAGRSPSVSCSPVLPGSTPKFDPLLHTTDGDAGGGDVGGAGVGILVPKMSKTASFIEDPL